MGLIQEFKDFAVKGNVADMAIGIVIGAAFGKIVSSLVADVIMPPVGVLIGGVDFTGLALTIKEAAPGVEAVKLNYGKFLQTAFDFLIVAAAMFMVVKAMNKLRKSEAAAPSAPPAPTPQEALLAEIRDILKTQATPEFKRAV